jgi:hypothetical protein
MSAVPHATDGIFCDHASLSVANGQVWDGLFCDGAVPPDLGPPKRGHIPFVGIRNIVALVNDVEAAHLFVTSRFHPVADAIAPVCKGSYGFIMCSSQEQAVADAICSFNIGTQATEFADLEGRGYSRSPDFVLEDHLAAGVTFLIGEADATVDQFILDAAGLTVNHLLQAWGIKNPTDEELVMIINTIRRRRR